MRIVLLVAVAPLVAGCAKENLRDWSEVLIARGSIGLGARASARIGGLAHPGLGLDASLEGGLSHGPYAGVHGSADILLYHVEQCQEGGGGETGGRACECAGLAAPMFTAAGSYNWLHVADLEVSVFAGVLGVGIGISFGELLDAITNMFGVDLDPTMEELPDFEPVKKDK